MDGGAGTAAGATVAEADAPGAAGGNDLATFLPPIRQKSSPTKSVKNTPAASQRNIFM
jgi:hypothetical protein